MALGAVSALAAVPLTGVSPAEARPLSEAPGADGHRLVPGTPCAVGSAACVALGHDGYDGKAWFIQGGRAVRGPVDAATGGPGEDTPTGTFHVLSKDIHHTSTETRNAEGAPSPMPYSVFFTKSGVAFHGGGELSTRTAGCVRLSDYDARFFYDNLHVGDVVQVVDSSAEYAPTPDHSGGGGGDGSGHGGGGGALLGGL